MGGGFLFARLTVPQATEGWTNKGGTKGWTKLHNMQNCTYICRNKPNTAHYGPLY